MLHDTHAKFLSQGLTGSGFMTGGIHPLQSFTGYLTQTLVLL